MKTMLMCGASAVLLAAATTQALPEDHHRYLSVETLDNYIDADFEAGGLETIVSSDLSGSIAANVGTASAISLESGPFGAKAAYSTTGDLPS